MTLNDVCTPPQLLNATALHRRNVPCHVRCLVCGLLSPASPCFPVDSGWHASRARCVAPQLPPSEIPCTLLDLHPPSFAAGVPLWAIEPLGEYIAYCPVELPRRYQPAYFQTVEKLGQRHVYCPDCPFTALSPVAISDHILSHISDAPYYCTMCDFHARTRDVALDHVWRVHRKQLPGLDEVGPPTGKISEPSPAPHSNKHEEQACSSTGQQPSQMPRSSPGTLALDGFNQQSSRTGPPFALPSKTAPGVRTGHSALCEPFAVPGAVAVASFSGKPVRDHRAPAGSASSRVKSPLGWDGTIVGSGARFSLHNDVTKSEREHSAEQAGPHDAPQAATRVLQHRDDLRFGAPWAQPCSSQLRGDQLGMFQLRGSRATARETQSAFHLQPSAGAAASMWSDRGVDSPGMPSSPPLPQLANTSSIDAPSSLVATIQSLQQQVAQLQSIVQQHQRQAVGSTGMLASALPQVVGLTTTPAPMPLGFPPCHGGTAPLAAAQLFPAPAGTAACFQTLPMGLLPVAAMCDPRLAALLMPLQPPRQKTKTEEYFERGWSDRFRLSRRLNPKKSCAAAPKRADTSVPDGETAAKRCRISSSV